MNSSREPEWVSSLYCIIGSVVEQRMTSVIGDQSLESIKPSD